jgi:hypothetical protein
MRACLTLTCAWLVRQGHDPTSRGDHITVGHTDKNFVTGTYFIGAFHFSSFPSVRCIQSAFCLQVWWCCVCVQSSAFPS